MRILAFLTLLISALLSPFTTAAPLELKWNFNVEPILFSSDPEVGLLAVGSINNLPDGGCVARITVRDSLGERRVFFVLDQQGTLIWQRAESDGEQLRWIRMIARDTLVFEGGDSTDYISVCLTSGREQMIRRVGPNIWRGMNQGYKWPSESILVTNGRSSASPGVAPETGVVIRRYAPASSIPDLAPSTFGLEDGNLIISWPTAAGQTYQVQRSTDLESWENIGVVLTGNGDTMNYAQPSTNDKVFLRIVIP